MLTLISVTALAADLAEVRSQINQLEKELLQTRQSNVSAANQLKKIKKLINLQHKEIQLSKIRVQELEKNLIDLGSQKRDLIVRINTQKSSINQRLKELNKITQTENLDTSWLNNFDSLTQKSYYLSHSLSRDLSQINEMKKNVHAVLGLELKILEEKNKIDFYVQEVSSQIALLSVNEEVQKDIIQNHRKSRLETLAKIQEMKEDENHLEKALQSRAQQDLAETANDSLLNLKGRLTAPLAGNIISGFGKNFNSKTNLLQFQKGISIQAVSNSAVKAVAEGKVVFTGPLKNYGLIVIIEHSGRYFSLYGQLSQIQVSVGEALVSGKILGKTSNEPLYFEIRNKNIALNPVDWFSANAFIANNIQPNHSMGSALRR